MQIGSRLLSGVLGAIMVAMLTPVRIASALEGTQPRITIPQPVFDFGTVAQGATVTHNFDVINQGDAPLTITRIQPSCGCTAAVPAKATLLPNESVPITVTYDTTGFQGYEVKTVHVYTDDPRNYSSVLTLQGNVKTDVEIDPPRLFFGDVRKGNDQALVATIASDESSAVKILELIPKSDQVILEAKEFREGTRVGKKITARLSPDIPVGTFRSQILIKTSSSKNPVLSLPVFARVQGDLKLEPADVSFGLLEGPLKEGATQVVELVNAGSTPIQIVDVESDNAFVGADVKALEEGKRYAIQVTVRREAMGTLRARLNVITNHPREDQRSLALPVYGIIAKKGT